MKIEYRLEYGKLATFSPNKQYPIYRWFHYKEAFARDLVLELLENWEPSTVVDPFCGVGTTLLAAKESGIDSVGTDVLPLAVFVSRVKTQDYDVDEVKKWSEFLLAQKPGRYTISTVRDPLVRKVFLPGTLGQILWYRDFIRSKISSQRIRDLFILALMNASMKCSFAFKDGAVIKVLKKPVPPVRNVLKREIKKFIVDLEQFPKTKAVAKVLQADARFLPLENACTDAVITSPPYLNKIEYTQVYRIEHALFLPNTPYPSVKSYVGADISKVPEDSWFPELPLPARVYLKDMQKVLAEVSRILRKGGYAGFVIGNAYFPDFNVVVELDELLAEIGEGLGLKAKKVVVLNERWATKRRTIKVAKVRESLVVFRKV